MKTVVFFPIPVMLVLAASPLFSESATGPEPLKLPPAREIPGITADDPFPLGCVDCHIQLPELNQDERISTWMAKWTEQVEPALLEKAHAVSPEGLVLNGIHPKATASLKNIPAACFACHDKLVKKAPPLAPLIHTIHLTGGEENHFLTLFQGECTHCHKLNRETGQWTIPSGPEVQAPAPGTEETLVPAPSPSE